MKLTLVLLCVVSGACYGQRPVIAEDYKMAKVKSITEKWYRWDEKANAFKPDESIPTAKRWHYDENGFVIREDGFEIGKNGRMDSYHTYERDYSGHVTKINWYNVDGDKDTYARYSTVRYKADTAAFYESYDVKTGQKTQKEEYPLELDLDFDTRNARVLYVAGSNRVAKIEYRTPIRTRYIIFKYNPDGTVEETSEKYGIISKSTCKYLYGWLKTDEVVRNTQGKFTKKYIYEIEYYK